MTIEEAQPTVVAGELRITPMIDGPFVLVVTSLANPSDDAYPMVVAPKGGFKNKADAVKVAERYKDAEDALLGQQVPYLGLRFHVAPLQNLETFKRQRAGCPDARGDITVTSFEQGPFLRVVTNPADPRDDMLPVAVAPEGGFKNKADAVSIAAEPAYQGLRCDVAPLRSPGFFQQFASW